MGVSRREAATFALGIATCRPLLDLAVVCQADPLFLASSSELGLLLESDGWENGESSLGKEMCQELTSC